MSTKLEQSRDAIVEQVVANIQAKIPPKKAALAAHFVRQFLATASVEDLYAKDPNDLYGAMLSLWNFCLQRQANEAKFRIYNPNYEKHGWLTTHTVVEVCVNDMPFLVDSFRMELDRLGYTVHIIIHEGGLWINRDHEGTITELQNGNAREPSNAVREAILYIEIDRQSDATALQALQQNLEHVFSDVRVAVEDWQLILHKVDAALQELIETKAPLDPDDLSESKVFLQWLSNDNFTFLGYREYELVGKGKQQAMRIVPDSGLGVLRDTSESKVYRNLSDMTEEARRFLLSKQILLISKTNTIATVHRPAYTDLIVVKRFNAKGDLIGERRFIGLYTSDAYNSSARNIPFLRHKVETVLRNSGLAARGHAWKELLNILETFPRDDLFQASIEELSEIAQGILFLQERRQIRLFVRKDIYGHYMSCLIYVPKERFDTLLRNNIEDILQKAFNGTEIIVATRFSDSVLARIHMIVRIKANELPEYDVKKIEQQIIAVARSWMDDLRDYLLEHCGEEQGNALWNRYRTAFPVGYREDFSPRNAVFDIGHIEQLSEQNLLGMSLYQPLNDGEGELRLKLFHANDMLALSDVMPILENMGLRVIGERPYEVIDAGNGKICINDFGMSHAKKLPLNIDQVKDIFQEAFSHIWFGHAENDGFNYLVLSSQLNWRQVTVLRTYVKYLRQIGFTFSQNYIEETLAHHPLIAKKIVALFENRFQLEQKEERTTACAQIEAAIQFDLEKVSNLDEDRIIRRLIDVVKATLRTNYFQTDAAGQLKSYLSIKLDPARIPDLPLPRPLFEIFVYSPRFEGVHLRGGRVARGGIRWSDRREDFRTEVLGLMKAQQVKNSVIVPLGAKGGFIPKALPTEGSREQLMAEVIYCYQNFIRGLLDITDNLKDGMIVPPQNVIRYDEDDHYLVVAADKGTATFSDLANSISQEYQFWLDDAFASGGSSGYDHKKMGITARGAWESVKRHFRELGIDTQHEDFTVIGIGDMSGDVFGNGMLQSPHIKLVAAFNHQHIFIDPNPNPAISFAERQRLFSLPRSTWADYDAALISEGGGIFQRNLKSIKITPQMQTLFDIEQEAMVPSELIRAILRAKVDLLWNGGIGTYIRASTETDINVGDRTNDSVRVTGKELRAQVVAEGGNLGCTQSGRVEYALKGGIIFTDFIDNSAGVDCSDHEVNIKILLNKMVDSGDLTRKQRDQLLAEMTNEVGQLVIQDNYRQTQAISLVMLDTQKHVDLHNRYIEFLEQQGKLDRDLEHLPTVSVLMERKSVGGGLTRPEVAVLISYTKNYLKEQILASNIPEDPDLSQVLELEFPKILNRQYALQLSQHSLRREIVATQLANQLVNEMGFSFVYRLQHETGATVAAIVQAYVIARSVFNLRHLWTDIEALDYKVKADVQIDMLKELSRLIRRASRWFLRRYRMILSVKESVNLFLPSIDAISQHFPKLLIGEEAELYCQKVTELTESGVSEEMAIRVASTQSLLSALDIIQVVTEYHYQITETAKVYFALSDYLELGWVRERINAHSVDNHWEALAREALRDDLDWQQRNLTIAVMELTKKQKTTEGKLQQWRDRQANLIARWKGILAELRATGSLNYVIYSVAVRELLDLTQTSFHATKLTELV